MKNILKITIVSFFAAMLLPVASDDHMEAASFFPFEFYHGCELARGKEV